MSGKNFSANNMGQRRKSDFYETPYSITEQLLIHEFFPLNATILEPACGNGAITAVLQQRGFIDIIAYDKDTDFLKEIRTFDYIITNPPYSLADEFILQAKKITHYKFAFLLPLSYLHGQARYEKIYSDTGFPLDTVHVFTRYPLLGEPLREDGKYHTGMMVYAWFVWNKHAKNTSPQVKWIDNNQYVLRKRE